MHPIMRSRFLAPCLALLSLPGSAPAQRRAADPAVLLQAAMHQETVNGNLDSAITLYRRITGDRRADRATMATALMGLGRAHEALGQAEAQRAYQRVVSEFSDQREQVAAARQRLALLTQQGGPAGAAPDPRLVYSIAYDDLPRLRDHDAPHYDFSPDGDQIVMRVPADTADSTAGAALVVVNSGGAVVRTLVPSRREVGISFPRWSPDGRHIVYREAAWMGADTSFNALRIIPAAGGAARTLSTRHVVFGGARGGLFWTPDGRGVTVVREGQVVTLDLDGQVVRTVPFALHHLTQVVGYSPDGRWLAFHRLRRDAGEHEQMDVWVVPAEGGREVQVTESEYWEAWPAWAADGRSLFFMSNRGGSQNIWRVSIDPRTGAPLGEPAQVTSYTDVTLRHPKVLRNGKVAFALIRQTGSVRVASVDRPEVTRVVARGTNPRLSPDGRTVYYLGQGVMPRGIFAVATDGAAAPRRLNSGRPGIDQFGAFSLSPDGSVLAFFAQSGAGRVLRTIETAGGATRDLLRLQTRENLVPAWSSDGTRLAYTHGDGLFVISARGGEPRRVAQLHRWEGWTVRWSPDHRYLSALAYPRAGDSTNAAIVVPSAGGEPRILTPKDETGYKEILEWHPDGQRLTYMYYGHDDTKDETRYAYLDGRPTTKLLDQPYPVWDYTGTWHPGGRDYYFVASTSGSWSLYAHDTRTGMSRVVWHHRGTYPGASLPTFSRDGSAMAFATATTTRQLWVIDGLR